MGKCINCGEESTVFWFCPKCTEIKEAAYKEAEEKGVKTWMEVIEIRDKALFESKTNKNGRSNNK